MRLYGLRKTPFHRCSIWFLCKHDSCLCLPSSLLDTFSLLNTDSASVMRSTTPRARTQINIRHRQSYCIVIYYYYMHWTVEVWAGKVRVGVGRWGCEGRGAKYSTSTHTHLSMFVHLMMPRVSSSSVCLSVCLPVCLSVLLLLSVCLAVCLSVCLSVSCCCCCCSSSSLSVFCLPVCLFFFFFLSVCLSVCLSVSYLLLSLFFFFFFFFLNLRSDIRWRPLWCIATFTATPTRFTPFLYSHRNVKQNNFRGVDKGTFDVMPRLQHM